MAGAAVLDLVMDLVHELHLQMVCDDLRGLGDTTEADAIRDRIDVYVDQLTEADNIALGELSVDLYLKYGVIDQ